MEEEKAKLTKSSKWKPKKKAKNKNKGEVERRKGNFELNTPNEYPLMEHKGFQSSSKTK